MKKVYYLSTCDTCKRILNELDLPSGFLLQDIKTDPLKEADLEDLFQLSGSYEVLFSKRARLYKERDLKSQNLTENDIKKLLLEHYTFLKRPVIIYDDQLFIGNSKKTVSEALKAIHG
ncbi:arsenate reductase family protein [Flavobacteriaceae bacterium M23B6Z8]